VGKGIQQKIASESRTCQREFSAGGVVYKKLIISNGKFQISWLVTASMPSKVYPEIVWRLPKGWIDDAGDNVPGPVASGRIRSDEESLQKAAVREVCEEGGIEAKIIQKIGTEKYFFTAPDKGRILKFVTFYLMEWVADLSEGFDQETSEILWLPFAKAYKKLSFSGEKAILKKANDILAPVA
jgi:8-oxo-dGTP pyrophosphatase MutT (NUDIX family)